MKQRIIEEWRKQNCYCAEITEQEICKKCGQELPEWKTKPCMTCKMVEGLNKFNKQSKMEKKK